MKENTIELLIIFAFIIVVFNIGGTIALKTDWITYAGNGGMLLLLGAMYYYLKKVK